MILAAAGAGRCEAGAGGWLRLGTPGVDHGPVAGRDMLRSGAAPVR